MLVKNRFFKLQTIVSNNSFVSFPDVHVMCNIIRMHSFCRPSGSRLRRLTVSQRTVNSAIHIPSADQIYMQDFLMVNAKIWNKSWTKKKSTVHFLWLIKTAKQIHQLKPTTKIQYFHQGNFIFFNVFQKSQKYSTNHPCQKGQSTTNRNCL